MGGQVLLGYRSYYGIRILSKRGRFRLQVDFGDSVGITGKANFGDPTELGCIHGILVGCARSDPVANVLFDLQIGHGMIADSRLF